MPDVAKFSVLATQVKIRLSFELDGVCKNLKTRCDVIYGGPLSIAMKDARVPVFYP